MHVGVADTMTPGFQTPAQDAQGVFRVVLEAMAYPGRIFPIPEAIAPATPDLDPAMAAVCLTLLDGDTPLWTDLPQTSPTLPWLRFHCGCPVVAEPGRAVFGLATSIEPFPGLDRFHPGTDEAPESAATLMLQVEFLASDGRQWLSGPGIPDKRRFAAGGLDGDFWRERRRICGSFPVGLDLILVSDRRLAALPRTTIVDG